MSRVWGEEIALLEAAGADVDELRAIERAVSHPATTIVDAHVHLGRDADGHVLTAENLKADMDRWGIDGAVAFPASEPGADGQFSAANLAVRVAAEDERITAFCRLDPASAGWRQEFERGLAGGVRGVKLHPVGQSFRPESDECIAVVGAATEAGLPVLFHAGFGARRLAGPFADLRAAVPEARLILAHGGRGDARALAALFAGDDRVLFDTSLAALADLVALPPERLCFGSDRPYGDYATAIDLVTRASRIAGWSGAETQGVWHENLRRWLA